MVDLSQFNGLRGLFPKVHEKELWTAMNTANARWMSQPVIYHHQDNTYLFELGSCGRPESVRPGFEQFASTTPIGDVYPFMDTKVAENAFGMTPEQILRYYLWSYLEKPTMSAMFIIYDGKISEIMVR